MNKDKLRKALVMGVVFLFICVGGQPAFAIESGLSSVKSMDEEDCDCQEVDRQNSFMVDFLLNRLEVVANILLSRFGYMPEIHEKSRELLDNIDSIRQLNHPIVCKILEIITPQVESLYSIMTSIQDNLKARSPIIGGFIVTFMLILQGQIYVLDILLNIAGYHLCNWPYPPW